jgi:hypothetical protein
MDFDRPRSFPAPPCRNDDKYAGAAPPIGQ